MKALLPCRLLDTTHRWRQFALWNGYLAALSASALIILMFIAVLLYHLFHAHLWLTMMVSPDAFSEHAGALILKNVGADEVWLLFSSACPLEPSTNCCPGSS